MHYSASELFHQLQIFECTIHSSATVTLLFNRWNLCIKPFLTVLSFSNFQTCFFYFMHSLYTHCTPMNMQKQILMLTAHFFRIKRMTSHCAVWFFFVMHAVSCFNINLSNSLIQLLCWFVNYSIKCLYCVFEKKGIIERRMNKKIHMMTKKNLIEF